MQRFVLILAVAVGMSSCVVVRGPGRRAPARVVVKTKPDRRPGIRQRAQCKSIKRPGLRKACKSCLSRPRGVAFKKWKASGKRCILR